MAKLFDINKLNDLIQASEKGNYRFVAPSLINGKTLYKQVKSASEVSLDQVITDISAKEFYFSQCEEVASCERAKDGKLTLSDPLEDSTPQPTVIFATRPCDAAAIPIIEHVFRWDFDDKFVLDKIASNVVISIACEESLPSCFCTSVGCSPSDERGSDILLLPSTKKGLYSVKLITDKGKDFAQKLGVFSDGEAEISPKIAQNKNSLQKKFDIQKVQKWLENGFDSDFWNSAAPTCLGCAACAFTCPTCHCFDIADEGNVEKSVRFKSWDACLFPAFTVHTSGHNPRSTSAARYRQRINHKFNYYPGNFKDYLCTGCGRCFLNCPVGIDMSDVLVRIDGICSEEK